MIGKGFSPQLTELLPPDEASLPLAEFEAELARLRAAAWSAQLSETTALPSNRSADFFMPLDESQKRARR
jgi:hypothetical protein